MDIGNKLFTSRVVVIQASHLDFLKFTKKQWNTIAQRDHIFSMRRKKLDLFGESQAFKV